MWLDRNDEKTAITRTNRKKFKRQNGKKMIRERETRGSRIGTFVLDGLALAGRSPFGDGPTDEYDEFPNAGSLEVSKMAHVRCVS